MTASSIAYPASLEQIQRCMAAALLQPLTPGEEMRAIASDGQSMADVAASFIAPNSRLSPFERLEIYNQQYWYRVLGGLREDFPALRAILGSKRFDALSVAYLSAHPSRSFTLRNLGSQLVSWLQVNPQFTGRRRAVAIDVARVEWAFVEAFDAADREPLTAAEIATLDANSRLSLQPYIRLLELGCPADELVVALHTSGERHTSEAGVSEEQPELPPAPLPKFRRRSTWVAAHRMDFSVYYRRLQREEFLTLGAIGAGLPLGEALSAGFAQSRVSAARQAACVQQWFAGWAELGWICAPSLESLLQA